MVGWCYWQWTWVWVNSGRSWWWTGKPGVLFHGVAKSWTQLSHWTELNWTEKEEFMTPGLWGWSAPVSQGQSYDKDMNSHHLSLTPVWLEEPAIGRELIMSTGCEQPSAILSRVLVAQSCQTLCDPMGCSLSGSSFHGIFQARILEWVAISFFKYCHSKPSVTFHISHPLS